MSLKLGNTSINKLYLGSGEVKKAYLGNDIVFDNSVIPLYDDVSAMYTLQRPSMTIPWTEFVIGLRRTSDNTTKQVYFDTNGEISLNSPVVGGITLGDWVGANDAYIHQWAGITPNNTIDLNKIAEQFTNSLQPQFISSGVIITKNGNPSIAFLNDTRYLEANTNTDLDSSNTFTSLTVSNNNTNVGAEAAGAIWCSSDDTLGFIQMVSDRRIAQKRLAYTFISGGYAFSNLLSGVDSSDQRLLNLVKVNKDLKGYYNGAFQNTATYTGDYINNALLIGAREGGGETLNGTIQEIIIFPSDKTSDLTELNNDINARYNIY